MARQKRMHIPGGIYHVITRGLNRAAIFKDRADKREFLLRLEAALSKTSCRCYAWVLLNNHLHLLIRTSDHSLSEMMRIFLTGYALYFNVRHKRRGYLFQNRFKSILCQEEPYFLELVRYIHLNPVRAGLVETLEELDRYPWSGHAVLTGKRKSTWQTVDEVLAHFGNHRKQAITAYRQYLADGWNLGKQERLTGGGLRRSAGGWQNVLEAKRRHEFWRGEDQILGDDEFVREALKRAEEALEKTEQLKRNGWTLEQLAEQVCSKLNVKRCELTKKGRNNNLAHAKGLIAFWGKTKIGQSGAEIARFLGMTRGGAQKAYCQGERYAAERKLAWHDIGDAIIK